MFVAVGKERGDPSTNPWQGSFYFTYHLYTLEMKTSKYSCSGIVYQLGRLRCLTFVWQLVSENDNKIQTC